MTARRFTDSLVLALAFILSALCGASLRAQEAPVADEFANAKFQAIGEVNGSAVFLRSGPSENDYATEKLEKGARLTVVGERFNWLKVMPPDGSFCYVAKAYVNRAGNGSIGQVTSTLNVRIGSSLTPLKTKVATRLEPNQRVEIIGEQDEYFKIKPPADVYFYISKEFVNPIGPAVTAGQQPPIETKVPEIANNARFTAPSPGETPEPAKQDNPAPPTDITASKPEPTTQQSVTAEATFDTLEQKYAEITQQPIQQQPVEEVLANYQKLLADATLPESLKRICEYKITILKNRAELKAQFAETMKIQEQMKQKQQVLITEQGELNQRITETNLEFFTAVGTLRTSSLQQGQQTLYRLTDPANGRTVVYLRAEGDKLTTLIGQFVGIKGDIVDDAQINLRVITVTSAEIVSPAKVGQSIAAQLTPPSLLPGATAGAGE